MVALLQMHFHGQEGDVILAFCNTSPWAEVADVLQQPPVTSLPPPASLSLTTESLCSSPKIKRWGRKVCSSLWSPFACASTACKTTVTQTSTILLSAKGWDAVSKARCADVREAALTQPREGGTLPEHPCRDVGKRRGGRMRRARTECETWG